MKKNRSTKRALLMSALSMVLCLSMLVGSTFAWFTDSVTSKGNIIKSGTLDVEMYWADGKTDPKNTTWTDASQGAIFDYSLWEPGYTEVRHIKIENKGTLALKYQLMIQANGKVSKLSDVIDVYYTDPAEPVADRTALANKTPMGTLTEALIGLPNTAYGELTADEAHTITLALKMQESAGNEYQDLAIGSDFSIILMATQVTNESDSFGPEYDASAEIPEMDIKVIDGNTYHYLNDGNVVLASVPYGNVGKTFTVPNNVTVLGQGDVYDGAVPVFSKSSPIQSITLPDGLVEIKARAITGVTTLTSINFPSTLKAIRAQALRLTGMDKLTVPANVEVIGEGAFRDMANLTTVTVEGNVAFDNNAFRSCPNLTSIYLLGDDVTFTSSQFATHSDDGNATGITIYVKNATVAARVYAAQTSAYGYKVKILGEATDGSDAADVKKVANSAQLDDAIQAGAKAVVLAAGDYALHFTNHTNFNLNGMTINGLGDVKLAISSSEAWYGRVQGSNVTFENIHFTSSVGATGKATYNNCTFDSWAICASSNKEETTFNNCTINGCLNTSTDFSSGDVFVNNCIIAKAEYSGSMTMNFVDCQIGEIIIWNANTNLTNCQVTELDDSNVTNATVTIK